MLASTAPWQIVYMHHPPYTSSRRGSVETMQWPYKAWGADAVLAGHDHLYERLLVGNLLYLVNGAGGRALDRFADTPLRGSRVQLQRRPRRFGLLALPRGLRSSS